MNAAYVPRLLKRAVDRGLRALPVVVITGARQTGKSTLTRLLGPAGRRYFSLDDLGVRAQAERTPEDLVGRGRHLVIDEVQRVPDLLLSVKRAVDEERAPGRFVLTGSANLLLMRRISESLAGRAVYFSLWPFTRRERHGLGTCGIWEDLFSTPPDAWEQLVEAQAVGHEDWRDVARLGG